MQDVKHVMNLQSWGHKYINAGSIIAKRALSSPTENERMKMLKVCSLCLCLCLFEGKGTKVKECSI